MAIPVALFNFVLFSCSQIPRNNVATVQLGATVLEGVSRLRNSLIDGDVLVYNLNYGFTCHQLGNGCIAVQLSQPFLVSSMRSVPNISSSPPTRLVALTFLGLVHSDWFTNVKNADLVCGKWITAT
ncbi:unnamed protein product [Dibothriocephalus latus]|uniref:Uncharacterized protein n=1 Tax=Dibothriocephalus latus TaxID=60516 RepID=A0A3P6QPL0_DIBLA|nr:unnamed protein product [Dibothriocephalus latus]